MPDKQSFFEDGSSITWIDRETVKYEIGDRHVLVWVDYEGGFFSRGRVVRRQSLARWSDAGGSSDQEISLLDQEAIIAKVQAYFSGTKVRVEQ